MKSPIIITLIISMFLSSLHVLAQKTQAHITYDIEVTGDDVDPMMSSMMEGSTMTIAFKGAIILVEMNMAFFKTKVITDQKKQTGLTLMDMMGMKMAARMEAKDFEQMSAELDTIDKKVERLKGRKEILGFQCEYALLIENGDTTEVWYTKDLQPKTYATSLTTDYKLLGGFPLQMITRENEMPMTMTAKEIITKKIDNSLFEMSIPEGYEEMTMEEMENFGGDEEE